MAAYTITWKNYNGDILEVDSVEEGILPEYDGDIPTKALEDGFIYAFNGWAPAVTEVTGDAEYSAVYKQLCEITWKNYNDGILDVSLVEVGTLPEYEGETPIKYATAEYSYIFAGWDPEVVEAAEDTEYTAVFDQVDVLYNVRFVNYDGTVLQSDDLLFNATPVYIGDTPVRPATAEKTYTFTGWDSEIGPIMGSTAYVAEYEETTNSYTVEWKDEDGLVLETDNVLYGIMPTYDGETPTKEATEKHTFEFEGWTPTVTEVTGDAEYTTVFKSITIYKVSNGFVELPIAGASDGEVSVNKSLISDIRVIKKSYQGFVEKWHVQVVVTPGTTYLLSMTFDTKEDAIEEKSVLIESLV